jgi:hypothetical protein
MLQLQKNDLLKESVASLTRYFHSVGAGTCNATTEAEEQLVLLLVVLRHDAYLVPSGLG